jgi:hypothetical protein
MKPQYRSWPVIGIAVGMLILVLACGGGAAAPTLVATSPAQEVVFYAQSSVVCARVCT